MISLTLWNNLSIDNNIYLVVSLSNIISLHLVISFSYLSLSLFLLSILSLSISLSLYLLYPISIVIHLIMEANHKEEEKREDNKDISTSTSRHIY